MLLRLPKLSLKLNCTWLRFRSFGVNPVLIKRFSAMRPKIDCYGNGKSLRDARSTCMLNLHHELIFCYSFSQNISGCTKFTSVWGLELLHRTKRNISICVNMEFFILFPDIFFECFRNLVESRKQFFI